MPSRCDAESRKAWLRPADECRVLVSVAGAQQLEPTFATYDPINDKFQVIWKTAREPTGTVTVTVAVTIANQTTTDRDRDVRTRLNATTLTARHVGRVAATLTVTATLMAACSDTNDSTGPAPATSESAMSSTPLQEPSESALDTSEACQFLASSISAELTSWAGSNNVTNAPIAETRLGPQPDGGIPGNLADGCVWEVRGPDGGHVGVAVERFVDVDMTQLATLAADAAVEPSDLGDGRSRWDIPASDDSPSGAVLLGDASKLAVVRVESYSDNADRTFIVDTLEGSDRFFMAVGGEIAASQPD